MSPFNRGWLDAFARVALARPIAEKFPGQPIPEEWRAYTHYVPAEFTVFGCDLPVTKELYDDYHIGLSGASTEETNE